MVSVIHTTHSQVWFCLLPVGFSDMHISSKTHALIYREGLQQLTNNEALRRKKCVMGVRCTTIMWDLPHYMQDPGFTKTPCIHYTHMHAITYILGLWRVYNSNAHWL